MKRKLTLGIGAATAAAILTIATAAAAAYTLFGGAELASEGNMSPNAVRLTSNDDLAFSGIDFEVADGLTFAELDTLATDYYFESGSCGGGSPRFQVEVEDPTTGDTGNIHVYIGPPPNYTGCPAETWVSTGDLLEGVNPVDTSQLAGGTFYDPYDEAVDKYGAYEVVSIQLVADGGWLGEQIVLVDNTIIDDTTYTYDQPTDSNQCKQGGWQELTRTDGSTFKNQGDCIQFFNTGR